MTKQPTVLVVEDDRWLAEQYERQLVAAGYRARIARDGLMAMEMIDDAHPNAIVLDVFLPGPNGVVLLHELQSYSDIATIPVIVCTTSAADIPKNSLKSYGVRRVLDKTTMEPQDIVAAVRSVL